MDQIVPIPNYEATSSGRTLVSLASTLLTTDGCDCGKTKRKSEFNHNWL